jgi:hypothetical protein
MDVHRTFQQALNRNRILLSSLGAPVSFFYFQGNKQIDIAGNYIKPIPCYCALDQKGNPKDPDPNHRACYGTGALPGFERYGYNTIVISTTTPNLTLNNVTKNIDEKGRISKFSLSGNALTGDIISDNYQLTNIKDINFFRFAESVNLEENRIEYYYSPDNGTTYIQIPIDYTNKLNPVPNLSVIPNTITQIKFKITLRKRFANSSSPVFGYIKFRFRDQYLLSEIDSRFREINIPATLAAPYINPYLLKQKEVGIVVDNEPQWWTLPEAAVNNGDVILYLLGHNQGKMYTISNVEVRTYGKIGSVLSLKFNTKLITHDTESLGILKYLSEDNELKNYKPFEHFNIASYYPSERDWSLNNYHSNLP